MNRIHSVRSASDMITSGAGGARKAIRGWFQQGRITGAHQHTKHAQIWLDAQGVHEAWLLWAAHKGLDTEADMPNEVRTIVEQPTSAITVKQEEPKGGDPVVTVIVPPGVTVRVVQAA